MTHDGNSDVMTLKFEAAENGDAIQSALMETIQNVCKLKGLAENVPIDSLPNDGKVIEDARAT